MAMLRIMLVPFGFLGSLGHIGGQRSRHRVLSVFGICAVALLAACGSETSAPQAGVVAFTVVQGNEFRLAQQHLDTDEISDVAVPMGVAGQLGSFSADGTQFAFVGTIAGADSAAESTLYVADADGANPVAVAHSQDSGLGSADSSRRLSFPVFSPDGKEVAFSAWSSSRRGVESFYIVEVDGSNLRPLMSLPGPGEEADRVSFSADDSTVVFSHPTDGRHYDLYTADVHGGGRPTVLAETSSVEPLMPAFAPDGRTIVYSVQDLEQQRASDGDRDTALFMVDADGSDARRITDWGSAGQVDRMFAAWSPDGTRIVFSGSFHGDEAPAAIFVMGSDGKNLRQLSPADATVGYVYPSWR